MWLPVKIVETRLPVFVCAQNPSLSDVHTQASFGLLSYYTGSLVGPIVLVAGAMLGAGALAASYRPTSAAYSQLAREEEAAVAQI